MSLLLYAVESNGKRGFLLTTKEGSENILKQINERNGRGEIITNKFSFIRDFIENQSIFPVYNSELINKTNLQIDVTFDEWNVYKYNFKETYDMNDFKVTFDIEGDRIERESADINKFYILIEDNKKNTIKLKLDAFDEEIYVNGKKVDDYKINEKISETLDSYEIYNNFCTLIEDFEENGSTKNIVELNDIEEYIDIESFINDVYRDLGPALWSQSQDMKNSLIRRKKTRDIDF